MDRRLGQRFLAFLFSVGMCSKTSHLAPIFRENPHFSQKAMDVFRKAKVHNFEQLVLVLG